MTGNVPIQRTESGKIMRKAMCILCRLKYHRGEMEFFNNRIGICEECFSDLPRTHSTKSFPAIKTAEYVVSPFYYKGRLRRSMLDFKFNFSYAFGDIYARLMYEELKDLTHLREFDMIIPVPMSKERMRERGYNQASLVAQAFSEYIKVPYREDILIRHKNTKRQSGLWGMERATNILGAFSSSDVFGKRILLLDDIHTTGNTIEECARTLKRAGAKEILGMVIAIIDR